MLQAALGFVEVLRIIHREVGHDAFVTSDHDDMLHKREAIRRRTGIVVVDPAEAVKMAHGQPA